MKKYLKKIYAVAAILFWIAVWHFASVRVGKSILLPGPSETVRVLFELASQKDFWITCITSVKNIFSGALFGVLAGILIAALSYISSLLKYLFSPMMSLVKATPIASVIILFLVWIGKEGIPYWISFMMVVPIVASNVYEGLSNINKDLWEVTKVYGFSFGKQWKILYRHSLLPYLDSALKSGVALAWKAGVAAEVLCTPVGTIGIMLYDSKLYLETPTLFAWTAVVVVISLLLEKITVLASRLIMGGVRK